ncbi:class I SAM-dependent methyltransferase [Ancylobacter oerskovii]|uniref:Class I SAM-dependent methyltransferase n=1 Tax=Ancylobacter oerskovii TaxID=459519 RepID=A0ABW4YTJ6_9HYPH|nr:class I SAM-dependent methyltransferase [Ancylobacter oerskovii]MBS7543439.1 class I SAM-dependent methyltransferase [Ancylobacter oerskovii]
MTVDWFAGKEFTSNFASKRVDIWTPILGRWAELPINVLELGSYEGSSAVFFARFFPSAKVTCIDTFWGPYERLFDQNIAEFGDRVEKIKGSGVTALDRLKEQRRKFQLIYLDGGKNRDHTLGASLLAWPMLGPNGVLIWDDYHWGTAAPPERRPHDGIDAFLALHKGEYRVRYKGPQMIIQKNRAKKALPAKARAKMI